ncbi:MAG: hypothetical protein A2144_04915 [Chloroflexi bacterium RBG_16_50_9]|nr:MAG: hypothetical protein A2144_04915 [Chloroflexi bacterium RBG_16_50_9]
MKQILWPESDKSSSEMLSSFIRRIWVHSPWGKALIIAAIPVLFVSGVGELLFGWILLKLTASEVIKEVKSYSWPGVEAIVYSQDIETMEGLANTAIDPGFPAHYIARIDYEYEVGSEIYRSNENIGSSSNWERASELFYHKYPRGTRLTVYYNPKKPQESTLKRGIQLGKILAMLSGTFIMLAFGAGLLVLWVIGFSQRYGAT